MSRDPSRDNTGMNVSATAQSGGHVTTPVISNSTITGDVHITHIAPGVSGHRTQTQTSDISSVIDKYKELICSEYQYVREYNSLAGEQVLLSERFTWPLIIQKHRDQKEREEDIRSSSRSSDQSVRLNHLFDPDEHRISPRAVMQGNSGNGKSFTVQKIMMDWASGDLYKQQFNIVFHLKCKEINRMSGEKSLEEILSYSCSLTSDQISQVLQETPEKMLFIVDGFDELRLTKDNHPKSPHNDLNKRAPPEVTLCALLRGRILPESFLRVTTRSTATDTLSKLLKAPKRFTEIMGFSREGVEKYFQGFFRNEEFFRKAYEYVKANETLITACSIPVICWIICTVMRERFSDSSDLTSGLETTTSIYADFVSTLLEHHCQGLSQSVPALLRSLGQLAEKGMLEQQVLLDEKMVSEAGADPAGSPFLSKFLFKRRIHQETMFSFMHLSFQEFFTALYYVSLDGKEFEEKFTNVCLKGQFAAVVKFLFGLMNEEVRDTLKRKHGVCVHPNTQNILKDWLFQHKDPLETLHHLFELHEESFVREVLNEKSEVLVQDRPKRRIDYWVLLYCGQCCQSVKRLSINGWGLTSENLAVILPVLHKFEELRVTMSMKLSGHDFLSHRSI